MHNLISPVYEETKEELDVLERNENDSSAPNLCFVDDDEDDEDIQDQSTKNEKDTTKPSRRSSLLSRSRLTVAKAGQLAKSRLSKFTKPTIVIGGGVANGGRIKKYNSFRERKPISIRLDVSGGLTDGPSNLENIAVDDTADTTIANQATTDQAVDRNIDSITENNKKEKNIGNNRDNIEDNANNNSQNNNMFTSNGSLQLGAFTISEMGLVNSTPSKEEEFRNQIIQKQPLRKQLIRTRQLGQGASAMVYEALHAPSLTLVAEKVMPAFDPVLYKQIVVELATLLRVAGRSKLVPLTSSVVPSVAKGGPIASEIPVEDLENKKKHMDSQYVVGVFDVYTNVADGSVSIVQELMAGGSLQDFLDKPRDGLTNKNGLSLSMLSYVAHCVLSGLSYLRKHAIIHGDIKPANLLMTAEGDVKLSDFGISQKIADSRAIFAPPPTTRSNGTLRSNHTSETPVLKHHVSSVAGTLRYMSPERVEQLPYSYAADVWAFGMLLFTCAIGEYPVPSNDRWDVMNAITGKTRPDLLMTRLDLEAGGDIPETTGSKNILQTTKKVAHKLRNEARKSYVSAPESPNHVRKTIDRINRITGNVHRSTDNLNQSRGNIKSSAFVSDMKLDHNKIMRTVHQAPNMSQVPNNIDHIPVSIPNHVSEKSERHYQLFDLIQKCLQRDPKKRPSAEELLAHPFVCNKRPSDSNMFTSLGVATVNNNSKAVSRVHRTIGQLPLHLQLGQSNVHTSTTAATVESIAHAQFNTWLACHWHVSLDLPANALGQETVKRFAVQSRVPVGVVHDTGREAMKQGASVVGSLSKEAMQQRGRRLMQQDSSSSTMMRVALQSQSSSHLYTSGILRKRAMLRPFGFMSSYKWDDRMFILNRGELTYHKFHVQRVPRTSHMHLALDDITKESGKITLLPGTKVVFPVTADSVSNDFCQSGVENGGEEDSLRCIALCGVWANGRSVDETLFVVASDAEEARAWVGALKASITMISHMYGVIGDEDTLA